ncbi:Lrp/AsnC family transcriptional regulator [Candidatus Woesearchaeota archaeon]|jgi:Lrp/AsnC family transcriptional regulator, leucine-responsive regulatory protein|nr:Lrp/AsnC family transcriptional regulator [Candidatus Woesearchaeota archaeon]MBT6519231.1 Lrp/AsnC family transcriptional regulator [Candidatus Woesearchaeota archaeon]MBT7367010.1 Lrp/AsnC family transcriptional regulator [Candidatus Woesearchaeota archaeon]
MKKIDFKDKKILFELDNDCRQSNEQIAKKVKLSKQSVAARIKKLQELGVIENFFVKLNPTLLGFMHIKILLKFYNLTPQKEKELIEFLNKQESIFWMCSLRGNYDLVFSMYIKNTKDFSEKFEHLFKSWRDYILERSISVIEAGATYTKAYMLPNKVPEEILYSKGKEEQMVLDKTDQNILSILNKHARLPLIEIASQLNLSADTIRYRIKKLQSQGIITGFGVRIDFNKLGGSFFVIQLKLQRMNTKLHSKLKTIALLNKNVITYAKVISDFDIDLELETLNRSDFDNLLRQLREEFALQIKEYNILEVTKEHRMTYYPFKINK